MVMVMVVGVLVVVDFDRIIVMESRYGLVRDVDGRRVVSHRGDVTRRFVVLVAVVSNGLRGRGVYWWGVYWLGWGVYWFGWGIHRFRGGVHGIGRCIYRRNGLLWVRVVWRTWVGYRYWIGTWDGSWNGTWEGSWIKTRNRAWIGTRVSTSELMFYPFFEAIQCVDTLCIGSH